MKYLFFSVILVTLNLISINIIHAGEQFSDDVVELESRQGITQRILVLEADNAVASVILVPGGRGTLEIDFDILKRGSRNLLVKTRDQYQAASINTIVLDTPSDQREMDGDFRTTDQHLRDVKSVADWAITRFNKPVWIVGQSMGSISAAHSAINLPNEISGLVLNASVTMPTKIGGTPITDMTLSEVTQPVLLLHHEQDGCYATPVEGAIKIAGMLSNSKKVVKKVMSGGSSSYGNPCYSGYHAFYDLTEEVTEETIKFIKQNSIQ